MKRTGFFLLILAFGVFVGLKMRGLSEVSRRAEAQSTTELLTAAPVALTPQSNEKIEMEPALTAPEIKQLQTLESILVSKNDNDPRLDTDFHDLSPAAKKLLKEKYRSLQPESLNEKGTVVFLLGQNIQGPDDLTFFGEVLSEPPCRSLESCQRAQAPGADEEHSGLGTEITLAYPQIVSLKALDNYLTLSKPDQNIRDLIVKDIQIAYNSKNEVVARLARELSQRINP